MKSMKKKKSNTKKEIVVDDKIEKERKTDEKSDNDKELLERTLQGLKEESDINPDLDNFFEKVKEKKEELDNIETTIKKEKELELEENNTQDSKNNNDKKSIISNIKIVMLIIAFIATSTYFLIYLNSALNDVNYMQEIINATGLLAIFFFMIIALIGNKKLRNIFSILISVSIIAIISINFLNNKGYIKLATLKTVDDFTNVSIADVMKWASANKVTVETNYEYSDNVSEGKVIAQSVEAGNTVKSIKKITVTVSNGPNYDKDLILSSWVGRDVDELIKYINSNHLNNVTIDFQVNNDIEKNLVISQSVKGEMKRSTAISFVVSLGNASNLKDIKIKDLTNENTFDATLYLKRNGIKYELSYEFSSKVKRDKVISQDPKKGTKVTPTTDTVKLVISKGKEIVVPDFSKASVDDVVNWIVKNNLKVEFAEKYSTTVAKNDLISVSVNKGDTIEEGTKITIITSKGALKVPTFNTLADFRSWASENSINYSEKYEYSSSVDKGKIISLSIKSGDQIDPEKQSVTVTISYGAPITVPYFVGSSRSSIQSTCNSKGLNCTFYYVGYNSAARDTALYQNVSSGTTVVSGTYVNIGLSSGPAKSYSIYLNSELFGNSYSSTVSSLTAYLNNNAPGVSFNFVAVTPNTCVGGLISPDSPIKGGVWNTFTQGQTYTIYVMNC